MQEECIEVPRYLADLAVSTLDNTGSCDFVRRGSGEVLHNQGCTLESGFASQVLAFDVARLICCSDQQTSINSTEPVSGSYVIPAQNVDIVLGNKVVSSKVDSGADLSIFRSDVIEGVEHEVVGQVSLFGAFGGSTVAKLVRLSCHVRLPDGDRLEEHSIVCAVSDSLREAALLTPADYGALCVSMEAFVPEARFVKGTGKLASSALCGLDEGSDKQDVSSALRVTCYGQE